MIFQTIVWCFIYIYLFIYLYFLFPFRQGEMVEPHTFSLRQTPPPNINACEGDAQNALCLNLRQLPHPD